MIDALKTNWAAAQRHLTDALGGLVEPDLAKEAARERALGLRHRLNAETTLLSARGAALETLFRPITRD